jgi:CspA family cold shock protein
MTPAVALVDGVVESFDQAAGLGTIRAADGALYPFHCTQVADGSRTIPAGVAVTFSVTAGGAGRWEAAAIHRCSC